MEETRYTTLVKCFPFRRLFGFVLSLLLLPVHFLFAVELSSVYVTSTTHLVGAAANYKFYLTLDGSSSWAEGESLVLTFPSGYALSSFTEDDIDIADDGVDLTTAATCGGSEHVGVSVSGLVVTFEMCAGDGGAVASSSVVEIELGLNASSSGTSVHQITNPSGAGSYFIGMSGSFGSGGSVIVPITASSGSGVSVSVPGVVVDPGCTVGCGGSSGDSAPDPDPEPDPDADPEPDPDPDPIVDPDPDPEPDPGADVDPSPDTDPDIDSGTDLDAGSEDLGGEGDADSDSPAGDGSESVSYDVGVSAEDVALVLVDGGVQVLADTSAQIEVFFEEGDPASVYVEIGDDRYALVEVAEDVWRGNISVGLADSLGTIVVEDGSGEVERSPLTFDVVSSGVVYEIIEGRSAGVGGALVTVLHLDGSVWNADAYGQSAQVITGSSGAGFSWYIPNGTYLVRVEKDGYETSETTVTVTRSILAPTLFISRIGEEPFIFPGDEDGSFGGEETSQDVVEDESVLSVLSSTVTGLLENVQEVFRDVTSEEAAAVAAPVAVAAAVVATAAVGAGQFWLLLYSFLSQPFLFFTRKKYRKVGVVYNSVTKIPLDLVTVRAYNVATNRLVKTVVTNEKGEFFLRLSEEGTYRLQAIKQGFVFPSTYLGDVREDGVYFDVYTGQDIAVAQHADPLAVSIPLDPQESVVPAKVLTWERTKRRIAYVLSPLSVFVSLGVFIVYASVLTGILFGAQVILYLFTWRIAHKKRASTWGIVYDEITRRPVGNVVIRLFEPKYNKLVDSTLSDARGRYVFALGPNEYYVTFAKDGYLETTVKPVDFTNKKDISLFGINLPLRRHNGTAHE